MKTLIEVGTYDGSDSLNFYRNGYRVYTFEPKKDLYKNLVDKTSHLENYTVIPKAVSLINGITNFNVCKEGGASSILQFRSDEELNRTWTSNRPDVHYSGISYEVETTRLDTFIEENNLQDTIIDYIHIDAQGVDLECLKSLGIYIKNVMSGVVETVIDINKSIYVNQNENTYENVEKFLLENGFKITGVHHNDITNCEYNVYFERIIKKKIAVLVYGRLNKCAEHYDNIIEHIGKEHEIDFFLSSDNSDEILLNNFINIYNPKEFINEKITHNFNFQSYNGLRPETNVDNMTRHFINKNRVFNLLEKYISTTQIHYDVVLSLRIDAQFNSSFIFKDINENTIYIPNSSDFVEKGINDQLAYGTLNSMKKYMNIILNCTYLLDNSFSIPHPESLTFANILCNHLNMKRFELNYYLDK